MSKYLDGSGLAYFWEKIKAYIDEKVTPISSGVTSFKGRTGAVAPASGDYTAAMVGADPTGTADSAVADHNASTSAHSDIRTELAGKETAGAAAAVQSNLDSHADNTTVHITVTERTAWNSKEASGTAASAVSSHNSSATAHSDIRTALDGKETAGAAAAVQTNLNSHTGDTTAHITAAERTAWNAKESGGAAATVQSNLDTHAADTTIHVTADERDAWNAKDSGGAAAAVQTNLDSHAEDTTVHITASERLTWNAKQAAISGAASTITSSNLTTNRALISNSSGKVSVSAVTSTELGYLDGVTSNVQTQLNGKETSGAAAAVQANLNSHTGDTTVHITSDERDTWNAKEAGGAAAAVQNNLDTHAANTTLHVASSERTAWNAKQAAITGGASTITTSNLTTGRALVSNSSGKVAVSAVTSTELGYLDGVTSAIQTQLNGKEASGTASSAVSSHNTSTTAHSDIRNAIPTSTSQLTNDSGFITIDDVPEGSTASTTTPKMDGTAATGSETAFARGDHVHPTDTSRASASALTTHTSNTTIHVTSSEHTQIGYLSGATSNIQTQIDTLSTTINSKPSMSTAVVYLSTDGWTSSTSGYCKTVSASGVTTSSNLIVTPLADYRELWQKANICCGAQGANTLTFYADKVPESTVAVNVLILSSEVTSGNVSMSTATASLTSGGWSTTTDGVSKTVTVSGVTSSSNLIASPDKDSRSAWSEANICAGAQGADTITFYADKAPEETVTVNVLILN